MNFLGKFLNWWKSRRITANESPKQISEMTRKERLKVYERGLMFIFPDGYWTCWNHGQVGYLIPRNQQCSKCNDLENVV